MKTVLNIYFIASFLFLFSCKQAEQRKEVTTGLVNIPATASGKKADEALLPAMVFEELAHDFGKISQGEKVSYSFKFKNTGGSDLVISSAQGSCGCTVPHYPKDPIAPGQEAAVDVVFDSDGKEGNIKKTVTIVTNANPSTKIVTITTEIIAPKKTIKTYDTIKHSSND